MKVLVIIGSSRKKNEYEIIKIFENNLKDQLKAGKEIDFEYIFLSEVNLMNCKGCGYCTKHENCILNDKDDGYKIEEKLKNCDLLILSSPVYSFHVSGLLKIFIDRFHYNQYYPKYFNKKAIVTATCTVGGLKETLNYLSFITKSWGLKLIKKIGVIMPEYRINREYKDKILNRIKKAAKKIQEIDEEKKELKITNSYKEVFNINKLTIEKLKPLGADGPYEYWNNKQWLDNNCYFNEENLEESLLNDNKPLKLKFLSN